MLRRASSPDAGAGGTSAGGGNGNGGKTATGGKRGDGGDRGSGGNSGSGAGGSAAASGTGGVWGDAAALESGVAGSSWGDAVSDPCEPAPPPTAAAITARCAAGNAPVVDGKLDDWPASTFTNDITHALGEPYGLWSTDETANAANLSARFAVRWDPDALYVAAQIRDDARATPDLSHFYQNDAFELFLDGANDGGEYGTDDIQLLVDAAGQSQANHYPTLDPFPVPAGVTSAVTSAGVAATWNVELRVAWSVLGSAAHGVGDVIGFDTAIDDNDTGARERAIVWRNSLPSGCACAMAPNPNPCEPYCYAGTFFRVQLGGR